jgi:tetratricopeptide (TPR) repeat protein
MSSISIQSQSVSEVIEMIKEGKFQQAKIQLKEFKKNKKPSDSVLYLLGLLTTNGDTASSYYERLLNIYPESRYNDDALLRLAQIRYAKGLYLAAQNQFNKILDNYPQSPLNPKCQYWIGLCHLAMGQKDSAAFCFNKIITNFPKSDTYKLALQELQNLKTITTLATNKSVNENLYIRYAIQVGAFTHQNNALIRKAFFEREGYQVNLRTKTKNGTVFYLIWVGSFDTRKEGLKFKEKLKKKYGGEYTIVTEGDV